MPGQLSLDKTFLLAAWVEVLPLIFPNNDRCVLTSNAVTLLGHCIRYVHPL